MNFFAPLRKKFQNRHKPSPFLARLLGQAYLVVQGSQALLAYIQSPSRETAARVRDIEEEGDRVRRGLIVQLNRSFITPIDREDLFKLSRAIDDVLDYMYSTTREMYLLQIAPNDRLHAMGRVLHVSAREIYLAIKQLEADPERAGKHALRVLALENRMDHLYIEALAELFHQETTPENIVNMLKLREIYRHMNHAEGSAEIAANLINDIIVKFY
jgi:predicted phosphate transport protein (TIGR00153 family)